MADPSEIPAETLERLQVGGWQKEGLHAVDETGSSGNEAGSRLVHDCRVFVSARVWAGEGGEGVSGSQ